MKGRDDLSLTDLVFKPTKSLISDPQQNRETLGNYFLICNVGLVILKYNVVVKVRDYKSKAWVPYLYIVGTQELL